MKWTFAILMLFAFSSKAQWKSYKLVNNDRDTINGIDNQDRRQGKWVIKVEGLRGEPGYDEEGIYKDGKKEGAWRCYTSMGDLYAVERFRWGNKDGKCQYFNIAGLQREESWRAVNPDNPYDTVDVYDPIDPTKVEQKVVKIEGTAVKHGQWKYYESGSGALLKTENYILGKLEVPKPPVVINNGGAASDTATVAKPPVKVKPPAVQEFEKKNSKRKVKVLDGSAGL